MALPTSAIVAALIARYRADGTLAGLLGNPTSPPGSIFDMDALPTNTPFPYVAVWVPDNQIGTLLSFGQMASDNYAQVFIYTQAQGGGFQAARRIASQIHELSKPDNPLDLSASGFANCFLMFDNEQQQPEPDGITQAVVQRYKLMTVG